MGFLTVKAILAFVKLKQGFIKALILYHFDPEYHICVETNLLGYAIYRVFSQLTLDNLSRWYSVIFFSRKIIPVETRYKTHDSKLLAIIKVFKT